MPTQWESIANEHILGIAPYEPGKPIEELERELNIHNPIKLASNENPLPPSERVQKAIIAALTSLDRYPDGSGYYLRQALAKKHGVMPTRSSSATAPTSSSSSWCGPSCGRATRRWCRTPRSSSTR